MKSIQAKTLIKKAKIQAIRSHDDVVLDGIKYKIEYFVDKHLWFLKTVDKQGRYYRAFEIIL